jgi:hypothetical protein
MYTARLFGVRAEKTRGEDAAASERAARGIDRPRAKRPIPAMRLKGPSGVRKLRALESLFRVDASRIHGFGVFARVPIPAETPVMEYVGEIIRRPVADRREAVEDARHRARMLRDPRRADDACAARTISRSSSTYMFALDERDADSNVVDATWKGNAARFANHSCSPNCRTKSAVLNAKKRIILFSMRNIDAGEELVYDYQFAPETREEETPCFCGAPNCRGVVNVRPDARAAPEKK